MSSRYIPCTVANEYLQGAGVVIGAEGSHSDVYLRLKFETMWDDLTKYVTFRDALGENPVVVMLLPTMIVEGTTDTYDVPTPAEAKAHQGNAMVTVYGYTVDALGNQEETATLTATAYFRVLPSDYATLGDESITPTIAQQLQASIDEVKEDIASIAGSTHDAEAWAIGTREGEAVEEDEEQYHNNAKYYAEAAATEAATASGAATDAQTYAGNASGSATAASGSATAASGSATAAAGSATDASRYATNASSSATNAATSASGAAGSAAAAEGFKNTASQKATDASGSATAASGSATAAAGSATLAESYAKGGTASRTGEDTDNAKHYKDQAASNASNAAISASAASGSASAAADSAEDSEAWAVGQRGGTDVPGSDETYHNNAKYWAEQAEHAAAGGVVSFNGRAGVVKPQSGDYTAAMVGADVSGAAAAVQSNLDTHANNKTNPHGVTAAQAGADPSGTAASAVTAHNQSAAAHSDIRTALGNKADTSALTTHTGNSAIHITAAERAAWNGKADFPSGGSAGQILTKTASGTAWGDAPLGFAPQIVVTAPTGSTVTATDGTTTITATESGGTWAFDVPNYGTWTVTATLNGETASGSVEVTEVKQYTLALAYAQIYGIEWDGTSTPICSRTDNSANFADPVPYVAGASTYGSPFDDLYPWKDMTKQTESDAGVMVKIPKFWYKLTQSGNTLKVQIADAAVDGFSVCPACMDRGDGEGERDYVLVGRYHCAASTYKSASGVKPQVSLQQSTFRANIHNLGSNVYMMDFATRFTIWLLYIVEFANWNSQATIGKGCSQTSASSSAVFNMGYTDSMPYHTGTTQSSRDSYGGTQYRNIEGLWDNCYDRLTGCYNSNNGLMVTVNPANFAEDSGGVSVGTPASGWIAGLTVSASGPFPCFINSSTSGGGETAYVCDSWNFSATSPVIFVGGYFNQNGNLGMFYVYYSGLTNTNDYHGSRVLKLP